MADERDVKTFGTRAASEHDLAPLSAPQAAASIGANF
jgi:hypothetical protein